MQIIIIIYTNNLRSGIAAQKWDYIYFFTHYCQFSRGSEWGSSLFLTSIIQYGQCATVLFISCSTTTRVTGQHHHTYPLHVPMIFTIHQIDYLILVFKFFVFPFSIYNVHWWSKINIPQHWYSKTTEVSLSCHVSQWPKFLKALIYLKNAYSCIAIDSVL